MRLLTLSLFVLASLLLALGGAQGAVVNGQLSVIWGDAHPDLDQAPVRLLSLITPEGETISLRSSDAFLLNPAVSSWQGKEVKITGDYVSASQTELVLRAIELVGIQSHIPVLGSKPWVSVLCKFSDVAAEPEPFAYFVGMYGSQPGELDHYWREVSYENINVAGSVAVDWVVLPGTRVSYIPTNGGTNADLNGLFDDCTAAADSFVDFSNGGGGFEGINLMFNALLDCCAWGGGRFATLDGVSKVWRTTWEPPWGYQTESVIAHEMGHGFGLPHANNSDNDGNPYDSPWDVMSNAYQYVVNHPVYGALGRHLNTYHKRSLGWISDQERFLVDSFGTFTITIDHTVMASTPNYRMARISLPDGSWYTVESRFRIGNYEANMPGTAVVIHHIMLGRSEPAWVIDADVPAADFADTEGVMWRVGELFDDPANGVSVAVLSQTSNGFVVRITNGMGLFTDGFE